MLDQPVMGAWAAGNTTRRRGNSEGSNPVQRADGRWQVHIRHTDEDGSSRRHTVCGSTAKEARIDAWKIELKDHGLAESSIRTAYTVLRTVIDTAVRDKAIAHNPAHAVRRSKVTANEAAYLRPDQVRSLLAAAGGSRYAPLFALLVSSGLRRGEALGLHWSDVDLEAKLLRVPGTLARVHGELVVTVTKTAKSRRLVPLSPTAEKLLRDVALGRGLSG